jgi:hypothetical protein
MNNRHGLRSNSPGFWIGWLVCGASWGVIGALDPQISQRSSGLIALAAFAAFPLAIAVSELRSGYAWKNRAPGNRGVHRSEAPGKFYRSVVFHFVLAAVITGFGVWRFFHHGSIS